MIAIVEAWRAGLLTRANIFKNLTAGIILGILAIPLAIAFAIASGVNPEAGIYTAIIAGFCVSVFGGCRVQVAGPTSVFASVILAVGMSSGFEGVQITVILAGIFLLLFGILRIGNTIKFVPFPVVVGFMSGVGILLFLGQIADFLGLKGVTPKVFAQDKVLQIVHHFGSFDIATAILGILSLALLPVYRRIPALKKIPVPLQILLTGIAVKLYSPSPSIATLHSTFGDFSAAFPRPFFPANFSLNHCLDFFAPAFAIAILGSIESLLTAAVADGMTHGNHSPNQELIGEGIANIASACFGGIAATGAISRTVTNIRSGGNSPLAGIFSALTLVLILHYCSALAPFIPLVSLAAILFVVAYNMLGVSYLKFLLLHGPKSEIGILILTILLTLFCSLFVAVNVGIVLSAFLLMSRMANVAQVVPENSKPGLELESLPKQIAIYRIHGPFFFGMTDKFERAMSTIRADIKILILRFDSVPFIDLTGLSDLHHCMERFHDRGCEFIFCEADEVVLAKMQRFQIHDSLQNGNADRSFDEALQLARERCTTPQN